MFTLNTFLAHAGVCSRRSAVTLIKEGAVTVNDKVTKDPSYRVKPGDVVKVHEKVIRQEEKVYILLNKPKGYITTASDEKDRKTVLDLLVGAPQVRLYPVGRLDRNTTGLLVLTNDGELANLLSHPKYEVSKIYLVTLSKGITSSDVEKIAQGIELEDGFIKIDEVDVAPQTKNCVVGIVLHSGKNRIVRRIFEHLGYEIKKLDRVGYAGLTKKGLPVGQWRYLTTQEVAAL